MKRNLRPSISNDNGRRKRKVRDLDRDGSLTCRRDSSPISLKERHFTYPNNAKTSEFAFFKKFKEDANHRFSSSLPRRKELQSKKFNSSDCFREERASPVDNRCKDFTPHHLVENVTPVNCYSLHLPLGNSSKISEVDVKHAHKSVKDIQSKQRNVENDADIFSRKRQKLRQFIQNTSIHGTGEPYEKGNGVISMLLSRLKPESNQYKFNNNLEKLQRLPGNCCPRLDLNNSSSPCHLNESRGRAISHSDFSTYSDGNNFQVKYSTEFDCDVERKMTLLDVNGSPLTAAVENYRSLISSLFEPQYGLYDQGEHLHLRNQELEPLLLGWDTDDIKDVRSSSQLTELNTFAESSISYADDHQPNLNMRFGAVAMCPSPLPSSNRRNLYSLPYSSLTSYQIHGLSWHNVEKEEDIDATFNDVHLRFSSVPKCLRQYDNHVDDGGSHEFYAQNVDWLMNNVLDDKHQNPSVESLWASGIVFDFGRKYLSGSEEQCQTAYHILKYPLDEMKPAALVNEECHTDSSDDVLADYRPPFFIQPESFFQEGKVCSILTDKLSWDAASSEINVDIAEMNYI